MGLLDRFRREKQKEKVMRESVKSLTGLEEVCRDDIELYEALFSAMFIDPRKIDVSVDDAAKNAKEFEKAKDLVKARVWYEIAGGLAVYEGDVKSVTEFFSKCEKISKGTKYPILKDPKKAVAKAQEYYKKHLED